MQRRASSAAPCRCGHIIALPAASSAVDTALTQAAATKSPITQERPCAAKIASETTIQAVIFVVPAASATSLTARIPVAADLISIDTRPTAAVTVAPITAIPMSVAAECGDGEVTATTPAAAGHLPTTARAMSVATVSVDGSPMVFIPVAVEPPATITGIIPAATMAGFTPCGTEQLVNTHPAAEVGSTTTAPTDAVMEGPCGGFTALIPVVVAIQSTTT